MTQSCIFSIITPVSHDPSEIIQYTDLLLKKQFWLLLMLKTVVLFNNFMISFPGFFEEQKHLSEI